MKKYISIIGVIMLCGGLIVGCSSTNTQGENNQNKTELHSNNKEVKEFYEPIALVNDKDLKISAISVQYLNNYGVIELILENKSDKTISVSLDKLFFSGIEREARISCEIPAKSSANEYIYLEDIKSLEEFNDKIEGTFETSNTTKDRYKFMFKV